MPSPRLVSSTPVGPKKALQVQSYPAKPRISLLLVSYAIKQEIGKRVKAVSISLAQPSPKC